MIILVCGSELNETELKSIKDMDPNGIPKYPWITTIFRVEKGQHQYICSGSLISASHVLSGM